MQQAEVVMKKNNGQWEGALFVDGRFQRSATGTGADVVWSSLGGPLMLGRGFEEGTEIGVRLGILKPGEELPK